MKMLMLMLQAAAAQTATEVRWVRGAKPAVALLYSSIALSLSADLFECNAVTEPAWDTLLARLPVCPTTSAWQ